MESRISIPTLQFDTTRKQWISTPLEPKDTKINSPTQLTFITYNVWFEEHNFAERGVELRKIMEFSNADFICLQEVIPAFYNELLQTPWVQSYYISGNIISGYTTLILSKHPCLFFGQKFPTKMSRSLLYAELELDGVPTAVATVHLESLDHPDYRKKQLEISYEQLKSYKLAFLMGDFNFDSSEENQNIIPEYVDIWKSLHPKESGYTMARTSYFPPWRPDRVIMKKGNLCKEISVERVGMEPLAKYTGSEKLELKTGEIRTPSDHYGLKCVVEIYTNPSSQKMNEEIKTKETQTMKKVEGNFVWIDMNIKNDENSGYMRRLSEIVNSHDGNLKGFDDETEAMDYIDDMLMNLGDLTLILNYFSLCRVAAFWSRKIQEIKESFDKKDVFRVLVFTSEGHQEYCQNVCDELELGGYRIATSFDVLEKFVESILKNLEV